MVYFRYDASSSVITSHADQVLGCVLYSMWFIRVGKSEWKVFTLTNTNTLLASCEALKACTALTAQDTAPELITTYSETI